MARDAEEVDDRACVCHPSLDLPVEIYIITCLDLGILHVD